MCWTRRFDIAKSPRNDTHIAVFRAGRSQRVVIPLDWNQSSGELLPLLLYLYLSLCVCMCETRSITGGRYSSTNNRGQCDKSVNSERVPRLLYLCAGHPLPLSRFLLVGLHPAEKDRHALTVGGRLSGDIYSAQDSRKKNFNRVARRPAKRPERLSTAASLISPVIQRILPYIGY